MRPRPPTAVDHRSLSASYRRSRVAREHFATDRDLDRLLILKAAVNPANTTVATWAAELTQTIAFDVADRLIPESLFIRLRWLGIEYMLAGNFFIRVPTWSPTASRGLAHLGQDPHVAARKTYQRSLEFSYFTRKRLLQQYLPGTDIGWT
jgi:hypothetical protein